MDRIRMMWWVSAVLMASALLVVNTEAPTVLGQTGTPVAATAPAPDWTFVIHGMQDPYVGVLTNPREPAPGTRYVGFDVEVVNASDQPLIYANNSVYLRDEEGFTYRSGAVSGSEPALLARTLQGSERARGWVWFGVLDEATPSEILLVPSTPELRVGLDEVASIPGTPRPTATPTPGITPTPAATATQPATPPATAAPTEPPAATVTSTATPATTPAPTSVIITEPAETPEGTVAATATPEATATAAITTSAATETPTAVAATDIGPGSTVINGIADTNLRASPALTGEIIATLPLGTELAITGPSVAGDDFIWWPVTVLATGEEGYVADDLLTPLEE